jgi:hypothetical protein
LVASTEEDERIMETVQELRNVIGQASSPSSAMESTAMERISTAAPTTRDPSQVVSTVSDLLADEETRNAIMEQLPGVALLSRRVGAGLLKRAAWRTERAHALPDSARKQIIELNKALADALEPATIVAELDENA